MTALVESTYYDYRISYAGAHSRVRALWGAARNHRCVDCSAQASSWSYDGKDPKEQHQIYAGRYSQDPHYYQPRCKAHHIAEDTAQRDARKAAS